MEKSRKASLRLDIRRRVRLLGRVAFRHKLTRYQLEENYLFAVNELAEASNKAPFKVHEDMSKLRRKASHAWGAKKVGDEDLD